MPAKIHTQDEKIIQMDQLIKEMDHYAHFEMKEVRSTSKRNASCFLDLDITDLPTCKTSGPSMLGKNRDDNEWYEPTGWVKKVLEENNIRL